MLRPGTKTELACMTMTEWYNMAGGQQHYLTVDFKRHGTNPHNLWTKLFFIQCTYYICKYAAQTRTKKNLKQWKCILSLRIYGH